MSELTLFKNEIFSNYISISKNAMDIKVPISIITDIEVVDKKIISTPIARSFSGDYLSGYQLVIDYKINQSLKYLSNNENNNIFIAILPSLRKCSLVTLPSNSYETYEKLNFTIKSFIDATNIKYINNRTILEYISLVFSINY